MGSGCRGGFFAARLRHSERMPESTEFPHLGQKYHVMGVPRTVINETDFIEGRVPEKMLVEKMREVL